MTILSDTISSAGMGWPGSLAQEHLPTGWASIAYLDSAQEYVGPVREENTDWIAIDVLGDDMTFSRDRVIVTYR